MTKFLRLYYKQVIAWIVRDIWHKYNSWYFKIAQNYVKQFLNITRGIYAKYHYKICYYLYKLNCIRVVLFVISVYSANHNNILPLYSGFLKRHP